MRVWEKLQHILEKNLIIPQGRDGNQPIAWQMADGDPWTE